MPLVYNVVARIATFVFLLKFYKSLPNYAVISMLSYGYMLQIAATNEEAAWLA